MSDSQPENQSPKKHSFSLLLLIGLLLGGGAAFLMFRGGGGVDDDAAGDGNDHLALTRTALAATENFLPDEAEVHWGKLYEAFPEDGSVVLNRALNRVLKVDELASTANNSNFDEDVRKAARLKVSGASDAAEASITEYEKLSGDTITSLWLKSRVQSNQAILLPRAYAKTIRRDIFDRLSEQIEKSDDPKTIILGEPLLTAFDQLEDAIDGFPAGLEKKASQIVGKLSDKHPDNLFLAIRAARLMISTEDERAATYVRRTSDLAAVIRPILDGRTKSMGVTSQELIGEVLQAVKDKKWDVADGKFSPFFNVLNPEEIIKTDRRRAGPHPLDRLSFDSLRRLSAEAITDESIGKSTAAFKFEQQTVAGSESAVAVAGVDFDVDLDQDLAVLKDDRTLEIWKNEEGAFSKHDEIKVEMDASGVFVADLFEVDSSHPDRYKVVVPAGTAAEDLVGARHDTYPSILVFGDEGVQLIAVDGRGKEGTSLLSIVETETGLETVKGVLSVLAGDLEGDGDLDLIVATKADGVRVFVNRGNRTFFEAKYPAREIAADDPVTEIAMVDLDRDLDLDIVTLQGRSGTLALLENLLHLQFRDRVLDESGKTPNATTLAIGDFDGNVSWDIVIGNAKSATVVFSQTAEASAWTAQRMETADANVASALLSDFDNDSWQDLISASETPAASLLGPWGIAPAASLELSAMDDVVAFDFDRDGLVDLAGIADGKLRVARNVTDVDSHYVDVRFRGQFDNAANSGRVNHYGIGSLLEVRFGPHYRARVVTDPQTHFGIGNYATAGSVRVIMPNGLTQTIRQPKTDTVVEEIQSLKGSCPYLYAWNGEKMAFVTDCLWAAPLGLQVASGVVAKDRPWEYLKVDGRFVKPRGDHYDLRITEELWEIAYIDHVGLTAIDHPEDVSIWTNEKVGPGSIAQPTVFAFRDSELHKVDSARDTAGRDVTKLLQGQDREYVQAFSDRFRQGLCPLHWIDLDFSELAERGELDAKANVYLVLTGWIMPTDTSLNIQIDQNPDLPSPQFPSVWVPDDKAEGGWRNAIPFMGFPGGKTKTIVVDVTDVVLRDDPRFRIQTSAQIYWDDARLAVQETAAPFKISETSLLGARLGYHGYSRSTKSGPRSPELYDYADVQTQPKWPPLKGPLTKYGPCTKVVQQWDDEMVVMSGGDELQLKFQVPEASIAGGWKRDFVLHCVGWDKDADLNTLTGQSTTPLPSREMQQYPPTITENDLRDKVFRRNEQYLRRTQSFRAFWRRSDDDDSARFLGVLPAADFLEVLEGGNSEPK